MDYLFESILVGIYTCIIYSFISYFTQIHDILLFTTGFCKHFFGYLLGIHRWYCNNGNACARLYPAFTYIVEYKYLLKDSLYEGCIFFLIGNIIKYSLNIENNYVIYFVLGCVLHIIAEKSKMHKFFCNRRCK